MNEKLKLLEDIIKKLEYLEEQCESSYDKYGYTDGGHITFMNYFDKNDRDEMVKELKEIYNYFNNIKIIRKIKLNKLEDIK